MAKAISDPNTDQINVETALKDSGTWSKSLDVTIAQPDVNAEYDAVVGELADSVNMPGFRKGKVPRNIIEKKFGDDIRKQVTANLLQKGLRSAITKEKLDIVGEPDFDPAKYHATKGEKFEFNVGVEVRPTFQLGQYLGLSIEQEEIEVLPGELEESIDRIRERFAERLDAPQGHSVGERDTASGDLRFIVEGQQVHQEQGQLLAMEGHTLGAYAHLKSDFILGAKVGETRKAEEPLAQNFPVADARGKRATIEFEVKAIQLLKLPELDDALAQKLGLKSIDELKGKVRTSLLEKLAENINGNTRATLLNKILEATPFELPKRLTDRLSSQTAAGHMAYMARMGVTPEMLGQKADTLMNEAKDRAANEMRRFFVLEAICEKEGLNVSDEDIDEEIVRQARQRGMRASQLYDQLVEQGGLQELQTELKAKKALDFLIEKADIKIVPRKPAEKAKCDHPEHKEQPQETQAQPK